MRADARPVRSLKMRRQRLLAAFHSGSPARQLLDELQVPVVRAALSDPSFFVRDQHPARELLNAVAESGATWLGDEDTDPALAGGGVVAVGRRDRPHDRRDDQHEDGDDEDERQERADHGAEVADAAEPVEVGEDTHRGSPNRR